MMDYRVISMSGELEDEEEVIFCQIITSTSRLVCFCCSCPIHDKIYFDLIAVGADDGTTWRADRVSSRKVDEALSISVVDGDAEKRQQQPEEGVVDVHLD